MTSADRLLDVLKLFSAGEPIWTVERAAPLLGVSLSTAYRYFRSLVKAGLLDPLGEGGTYVLGPAVLGLDRTIRLSDPMLQAARPTMQWLAREVGGSGVILLCRLFQGQVMCIHQERAAGLERDVSYERGLPLPMFRGAASKVILAHLPPRQLKRIFERYAKVHGAESWKSLKENLRAIRRTGLCISHGELDPGTTGLGAPLFSPRRQVLGSIAVAWHEAADEALVARLGGLLQQAAQEIDAGVAQVWRAGRDADAPALGAAA
jgi:DNA-binding IclR family transcriptional regulator